MLTALSEYLNTHSFREVATPRSQTAGLTVHEYESDQFRLFVFNERNAEFYIQLAPLDAGEQRTFLRGFVAYLTGDETVTRGPGLEVQWLEQHHMALATLLASSSEGRAERERYAAWQHDFAHREQARMAAMAAERAKTKSWWKLW